MSAARVPTLTDLRDPATPRLIAREFCRVVRGHFDRSTFRRVRRLQAQFLKQNGGKGAGCPSAPDSFADANLLMADAWTRVGLLDPVAVAFYRSDEAHAKGGQEAANRAYEESQQSPEHEAGCKAWNRAYALAIEAGYDPLQVGGDGSGPFTCPRCDRSTPHEEGGAQSPLCDRCADALSPYWRGYWAGVEAWGSDPPHGEKWDSDAYCRGYKRGRSEAEALAGSHVGGTGAIA